MDSTSAAQFYKFNHKKMGVAFIINQIEGRKGSEIDGQRIRKVLKDFGFKVIDEGDNLNLEDIFATLEKLSARDYTKYNCFLMVIMTHGNENGQKLKSANGFPYDIADIHQYFYPKNCPTLREKPKLFFVQSCRGTETDQGHTVEAKNHLDDSLPNLTQRIPTTADILTMFASDEGKLAVRLTNEGSWFIQTLCDELEQAKNNNGILLCDLLLNVKRRVAEKYSPKNKKRGPTCQMPSVVSTLRKHCFLAPYK